MQFWTVVSRGPESLVIENGISTVTTMPVGSAAAEAQVEDKDERHLAIVARCQQTARPARAWRELFRRDPEAGGWRSAATITEASNQQWRLD
jgi:hypothetical protein